MQANYLSHWLLVNALVEHQLAKRAPQSLRVVFLSSCTHTAAKLNFQNLQMERHYRGVQGYTNTKLCNILAAREFQRRYDRCVPGP